MQWQTNIIEEWVFDKESFIAFMNENIPSTSLVCVGKPSESLDQFAITIEEEISHNETTDNT